MSPVSIKTQEQDFQQTVEKKLSSSLKQSSQSQVSLPCFKNLEVEPPVVRIPQSYFYSVGPKKIRISNSANSTKSLGVKRLNQYVLLKTLGTGSTCSVVHCMIPSPKTDEMD